MFFCDVAGRPPLDDGLDLRLLVEVLDVSIGVNGYELLHGDQVVQQDYLVFFAADTALNNHLVVQFEYLRCELPVYAFLRLLVSHCCASADHSVVFDHILVHYFLDALKLLGAAVDSGVSRVDEFEVLEISQLATDYSAHHIFEPQRIFSDVVHPFHEFVEEAAQVDLTKEVA